MGLRKDHRIARTPVSWAFPAATAFPALGLMLGGTAVRDALMYDRLRIADGEVYRLASAHLVHLDWPHLLLNLAGLALVWALVGPAFRSLQWLLIAVAAAAAIDTAFWWLMPGLHWYVGLSGVLHGLLVAGALGLFRLRRIDASILLALVTAKLAYEQLSGPLPGSGDVAGGAVITEAHLFGALGGAFAAGVLLYFSIVRTRRTDGT